MMAARLRSIPTPVWLLGLFLAILAAIHLHRAATVHLNPDEALHYTLSHQNNPLDAIRGGKTSAHPPLFFLALHFWILIGKSEWWLRLLPISGYLGMLWFAHRWGRRAFDPITAAALVAGLALSAPLFRLATELRNYTVALCFVMIAIDRIEVLHVERRTRDVHLAFAACLLAVSANYSAVWFACAFVPALGFLLWRERLPRSAWQGWISGSAVLALAGAGLYFKHLRYIRASVLDQQAAEGYLRAAYCRTGCDPLEYLTRNTASIYAYLFGPGLLVWVGAALVIVGLVRIGRSGAWRLGLLAGPWLVALAPALLGLYPYTGTRHSIIPAVFAVCCAAIGVGEILRRFRWPVWVAAGVCAVGWSFMAQPESQVLPAAIQQREFMVDAARELKASLRDGDTVLTDIEGMQLVCYYASPESICNNRPGGEFLTLGLDGFPMIVVRTWALRDGFEVQWNRLIESGAAPKGSTVWVFQGGWDPPLLPAVTGVRRFGPNLAFFPKTVN